MDLGTFHDELSAQIRRGTAVDAVIPGFVRRAARWIERNRSLQYMRQFATISIDPETDPDPKYIELADTRIKLVRMLRWLPETSDTEGDYRYCKKCEPQDVLRPEEGLPVGYWLDGVARIVLSSTPDEALEGELYIERYSAWPTADSGTHWLLDNAEDVLLHQSMMNFATYSRDAELLSYHRSLREECLTTLLGAEQESEWSDSDLAFGGG